MYSGEHIGNTSGGRNFSGAWSYQEPRFSAFPTCNCIKAVYVIVVAFWDRALAFLFKTTSVFRQNSYFINSISYGLSWSGFGVSTFLQKAELFLRDKPQEIRMLIGVRILR